MVNTLRARAITKTSRNDTGTATIHNTSRNHHGTEPSGVAGRRLLGESAPSAARRLPARPASRWDPRRRPCDAVADGRGGGRGRRHRDRRRPATAVAVAGGAAAEIVGRGGPSGTFNTRPQPRHGNAPGGRHRGERVFLTTVGALQDRRHGSALALLDRGRFVAHAHERVERARGAAVVDRFRRRLRRRSARSGASSATTSAAAAFSATMSRIGPFSPPSTCCDRLGVAGGVAAGERAELGAGDAEVERVDVVDADLAVARARARSMWW